MRQLEWQVKTGYLCWDLFRNLSTHPLECYRCFNLGVKSTLLCRYFLSSVPCCSLLIVPFYFRSQWQSCLLPASRPPRGRILLVGKLAPLLVWTPESLPGSMTFTKQVCSDPVQLIRWWCIMLLSVVLGKLRHADLDTRALDALKEFPVDGALLVLTQFVESNLQHVTNKSAFLCGVMKNYRQRSRCEY